VRPAPSHRKNHLLKKTQRGKAGLITLGRPRHVKRMKDEILDIGTWNVNTMLKTGKMQEIADQIVGSQIQIVALQEIRWKGHGLIKKDKYSVYYSCNLNTTGQAGTGFITQKSAMNKILGFEPISDRICKLRVKGKFHNITLINIYAPTEDKEEEIKEQFYEELQQIQDKVPKHDVTIILGDMNAKLGRENVFSQVVGRHTLHDISNENGEMVANYAISNDMFLASTNFQHKKIHIGTWTSPDHQTINQIDHIMVNKNKMRVIHDVRSKRGYNCHSDHYLVHIKIKQKLIIVKNNQTPKYKWDVQLLNQREKINKYQENIQVKLQEDKEETDINRDWQNLKQVILEAAKEFKSTKDMKNNHWWDDECKRVIQEKNEARRKCLSRKTRANLDIYRQKRVEAYRTCRRKKKEWMEKKIKELNGINRKKDTRKFYKDVRILAKPPIATTLVCKDKDGNILSEKVQILERWQEYFKELLNPECESTNSIKPYEGPINNLELEEPSLEEINEIIKNMKPNKAAGPDEIIPEFIKNGGPILKQKIHKLIVNIWKQEKIPNEWVEGILCPIYKKGDRKQCNNYRGISLLNITYKIFAILLYNRLSEIIEPEIGNYQMGFRPNRSTIDNIFIVRQIYEKCYEYNIDLYNIFIDFSQAFDTVKRDAIYDSLAKNNIPDKLIKLIKLTLQHTKMKVKVNNSYSEWFERQTGVRQGDPLSSLLFSVVLDSVITNLEIRGNITTRLKQICAYADDIVIIGRTKQTLIDTFCKLKHEAVKVGLIVNNNKTKYLHCTRKTNRITCVDTGEEQFEQVNSFKYLGTVMNTDNSIEDEIKERIAAGNRAFHVHKKLFTSRLISRNVKLQLYNTLIRPTVTYASETWVLKEHMKNKLLIFERKIMRKIFGPIRTDDGYWRIRNNQEINDLLKGRNIIGFIKKQRLSWLGHVERMTEDDNVQKIKKWKPMSKRPIGRPKTRWEDDVLDDIRKMNIHNWKKMAQNRVNWKKVVERARTLQ